MSSRSASRLLAIAIGAGVVAIAVGGPARGDGAPRMPAPAAASYARGDRAERNAACTKCHGAIAREHDGSLHARSFVDASFQRGYAIEPEAFCRSCHAPESVPAKEPDAFAKSHGVACVSCHVPDGTAADTVVTSTRARTTKGPHAVARVADFGTRACTSCHDFAFPGADALGDKGRMQKTAREHAMSTARTEACTSCHMRSDEKSDEKSDGHASHRFTVASDRDLLAGAVDVRVERDAEGRARFVVSTKGVGHAFPTGDLFRRLVLRVKTPRGTIENAFERRFRAQRDPADPSAPAVRFETTDTRLFPSRTVTLPAPAGSSWELVYQRVTAVQQTPPFAVTVESELSLHAGTISPQAPERMSVP